MNEKLININKRAFLNCSLKVTNFQKEKEGLEYDACRFNLNGKKIICRSAKVTPKKVGQFVTFWKRNGEGDTTAFDESDQIDFYIVLCEDNNRTGQFIFPIYELICKGIVSSENKEGKRGFRVYPKWSEVVSKQAFKTQQWQLNYFTEFGDFSLIQKNK